MSGTSWSRSLGLLAGLVSALALACDSGESSRSGAAPPPASPGTPASPSATAAPSPTPSDPAPRQGDTQKGRQLYVINCGVCHNTDPTKPGTLGPEIAGSARDLIVARVLHAAYPASYTPKRPTRNMLALPHLAPVVDDIAAYLASVKP